MSTDSQAPLFSFAVFGDTHLTADEVSSPTSHVRFAMGRTRHLVTLVNELAPDFSIHMGDVVAPLQGSEAYTQAVERSKRLLRALKSPMYLVPGNHDLGDKPMVRTAAPYADEVSVTAFEQYWGESYSAFSFGDCCFILLNASLLGTGTKSEERMRAWLLRELEASRGARAFLFLHYPIYLHDPGEISHYDNVDEPSRSWLLALLEEYRVQATFSGHAHNFFYNRYGATDMYVLPAISHVRADFGDLFRADSVEEHGWADYAKLGFFFVRVYADRYDMRFVRTYGKTAIEGASSAAPHVSDVEREATFGVFMRHPWASVSEMSCVFVDDLVRKEARDQWPILALWELGVERLRIPLQDLMKPASQAYARALASRGGTFAVFTVGLPSPGELATLSQCKDFVGSLEILLTPTMLADSLPELEAVTGNVGLATFLSLLETGEVIGRGIRVRSGCIEQDFEYLRHVCTDERVTHAFDGLAFEIEPGVDPWRGISEAKAFAASLGLVARCHVSMRDTSEPGSPTDTPLWAVGRVVETYLAALTHPDVEVYVDTAVSHDRGFRIYYGFVDRRGNPTPCHHAIRQLGCLFAQRRVSAVVPFATSSGVRGFSLSTEAGPAFIVLPGANTPVWDIGVIPYDRMTALRGEGEGCFVDLVSGRRESCRWSRHEGPLGSGVQFRTFASVEITGPGAFLTGVPEILSQEVAS